MKNPFADNRTDEQKRIDEVQREKDQAEKVMREKMANNNPHHYPFAVSGWFMQRGIDFRSKGALEFQKIFVQTFQSNAPKDDPYFAKKAVQAIDALLKEL